MSTTTSRPPAAPRPLPAAVRLLRIWFAAASRLAPPLAEWHAARLFLTPLKRAPRVRPVPGGLARTPRSVTVGELPLAGWHVGDGPQVLLVHGWSGLADDMGDLAAGLAAAGFRAVAFDMPAHGASPGRRTSLGEWRQLLPRLATQLGGVHAVVAHSLGAAATTLALEGGLAARGVVLLGPPLGPEHYLRRMRQLVGLPESRAAGMERRLVQRVGGELEEFDTSRAAASLDVPALILHDPADGEVPWAHGAALAAAWKGSTMVAMPGAGHLRILSSPDAVRRTVDFISAL